MERNITQPWTVSLNSSGACALRWPRHFQTFRPLVPDCFNGTFKWPCGPYLSAYNPNGWAHPWNFFHEPSERKCCASPVECLLGRLSFRKNYRKAQKGTATPFVYRDAFYYRWGGGGGGGMRPIPTWNETILSCTLSSWIMKIIQFFFNLNRDCFFHFWWNYLSLSMPFSITKSVRKCFFFNVKSLEST